MARQTEVPGTERKTIAEVTAAGDAYRRARDERIARSADEKTAKEALIAVMAKHGLQVYADDNAVPPFVVTVTPTKPTDSGSVDLALAILPRPCYQ